MELRSALPSLNMYNRQWRIRTSQRDHPPARFVKHAGDFSSVDIVDSLICEGSIISCDQMIQSLIGYDCFVHAGSLIKQSIMFSGCDIGARSQLNRIILDKNCTIAPGTIIGEDREKDEERFPFITPSGIVVFPKGTHIPEEGPIEFSYDMAFLLENDNSTRSIMKKYADRYIVADRSKHSHDSAGPRYRKFGPQ